MKYSTAGNSDLELSAITLGVWQIGDPEYWGETEDARSLIATALDHGITTFDTAELYGSGESERALGKALGADRDRAVIVSKVAEQHCAPDDLRAACEGSLQRLGTDRIDLYLVHWPNRDISFSDTYEAMARLRDEGKIRQIGFSNFGVRDLADWFETGDAAANQLGYSLVLRAVEDEILPACENHNVSVMVYMPLCQALLTGRWKTVDEIPPQRRRSRHFDSGRDGLRHGGPGCEELTMKTVADLVSLADDVGINLPDLAIAWLLTRPAIGSVVVGATRADQIVRNAGVASLELSPDLLERIDQVTQPLKEALGPNPDLWESAENSRIR
jgi:aryl-alcohol dehydrogenase-like predicted oxidoreductase